MESTQSTQPTNTAENVNAPLPGDSKTGLTVNDTEMDSDPLEEAVKNVEKKAFGEKERPKETQKEPQKEQTQAQKRKLLIDKKEVELDEEQLIRFAQKGATADKRLYEISQERKQLEAREEQVLAREEKLVQLIQKLETDPMSIVKMALKDNKKVWEKIEPFVRQQVELEQLSPEQRAIYEENERLRQEREAFENERAQALKQQEEQAFEESRGQFEKVIMYGIDKYDLPKTPKTVSRMVDYMKKAINKNQPLTEETLERIANIVREDNIEDSRTNLRHHIEEAKKAIQAKDDTTTLKVFKEITDLLGDELVDVIRRADLINYRKSQPELPRKEIIETPKTAQTQQKRGYRNLDDEAQNWKKRAQEIDAEMRANR